MLYHRAKSCFIQINNTRVLSSTFKIYKKKRRVGPRRKYH